MVPFPIFLALKYLRPKRSVLSVVTLISVTGVMLGVAILVIVLSVMTGFDEMWRDRILSFKPHLTVIGRRGIIEDGEEVCRLLDTVPGITGCSPVVLTQVMMDHRGRIHSPVVIGLDPRRAASISKVSEEIEYGIFDIEDDRMLVGIDQAVEMGIAVGDRVLVYSPLNLRSQNEIHLPEELTVSGIFDMGMRDFDSGYILTSLYMARELCGLDSGAHAVYVMTDDPFRFFDFSDLVKAELGPGYTVRTWKDEDRLTFAALSHEKTLMFLLLVFITIVAIFCVTNTLIVVTVQKTHEIGLLKALGFPSWKIMAAFVWHGWVQCLAGTAAGIGAGFLVLCNMERIMGWLTALEMEVFPKEIYGLDGLPWSSSPGEVLTIAAVVMVFCTLSSLIPALRAAVLDPVEALRSE